MKVTSSSWIHEVKPLLKELQQELGVRYERATILAADECQRIFGVSASGITVSESDRMGRRGFVARVYDRDTCMEYAASGITKEDIPVIVRKIGEDLSNLGAGFERCPAVPEKEQELSYVKGTEYLVHPQDRSDEEILDTLSSIRREALSMDERLLDCSMRLQNHIYHKLFLSDKKDLEQNCMHTCGGMAVLARKGEEIKESYKSFSGMCGLELMDRFRASLSGCVKNALDLLSSEPLQPGTYECICTPEVTGMIVHEAFGHGVEMDMFVKDRALAKNCMGDMLASPLVNMRDGAAAADEVASFFFDDEGNEAGNTLILDHGKLVSGMADSLSACRLQMKPTGNGRRESVERKAYTRMTNTFFEGGSDTPEEMIASVKDGLLLCEPTSGMEDPKNWGIQCMVSFAREIKDGKLTGRIFSPIILSGYVPDLLRSITMMSPEVQLEGGGACGKGYKEWVKVSDGGPWIKARIRLG